MHLLVREQRSLDEAEPAVDLGQSPGDILFLSFSDSDLAAMAQAVRGWHGPASVKLANLARLRHPMSVDLFVDAMVAKARCVVVRLLGGLDYWRYGAEAVVAMCRERGIPLAMLPGDGRDDAQLTALSTTDPARLDGFLRAGGAENFRHALDLAAHLAGLATEPTALPETLPAHGDHAFAGPTNAPVAVILFYRSFLLADDMAPLQALATALAQRGLAVRGLFVGSLKDADDAAFVTARLSDWRPVLLLNATFFAASRDDAGSPLDAADVPVLQLLLAGSSRAAWLASSRGLSQSDLAMQVVLPELDGRLLAGVISFKETAPPDPLLDHGCAHHAPDAAGIALVADRAAGWARLAATPAAERRLALVLSDYPAIAGQSAHAVGLDSLASVAVICRLLHGAGYDVPPDPTIALCDAAPTPFLSLTNYAARFATLPASLRDAITAAWGAPDHDPALRDGWFTLRHVQLGKLLLAVQPDRGDALDRAARYHDPALPPRHAYVAFYLALRGIHALIHLGTHGTLEWLPGKSVALSPDCAPAALLGGLPVIYPNIVNNPGEAAMARRRLGAVTIGHLTPPLAAPALHGAAAELERLIDDYAAADGLDRRRADLLASEILRRAHETGLAEECHIHQDQDLATQLTRLDAFICGVKTLRVRDGLHVFATAPSPARRDALLAALHATCPSLPPDTLAARLDASPAAEAAALLAALDGRFIPPGPAGAPTRGRADVLPTGRNLTAIDPRGVPTRAALVLAERAAADLLRRHLQDHGDWPRRMVIDLWGSATMRTGGEDFALALLLLGARPLWDDGSARVTGVEITPLALLDRPRIDVTLRISGLFRDAFEQLIILFDSAVQAIAARDEDAAWNPLAGQAAPRRVFGAAPGDYGAGAESLLARDAWTDRAALGAAYLATSGHAYGIGLEGASDQTGFAARVAGADAFLHVQDHDGTDVLEGLDHAAHEGGFAAAAASLGAQPTLYHADTSDPATPAIRTLAEEVARVARGRAANPDWIAGMLRHGYRGAAEIARALDGLHGFAATLPDRFDRQFDLLHDATLGNPAVDAALRAANPQAHAAMQARFAEAHRRGLWRPRRNSVAANLP